MHLIVCILEHYMGRFMLLTDSRSYKMSLESWFIFHMKSYHNLHPGKIADIENIELKNLKINQTYIKN
jgi:hypothetical protein